jgi:hypothetical protein
MKIKRSSLRLHFDSIINDSGIVFFVQFGRILDFLALRIFIFKGRGQKGINIGEEKKTMNRTRAKAMRTKPMTW